VHLVGFIIKKNLMGYTAVLDVVTNRRNFPAKLTPVFRFSGSYFFCLASVLSSLTVFDKVNI
jgi:hypothetical protein